jgi:putative Mg2+ transporter-C (MgtC) family protein
MSLALELTIRLVGAGLLGAVIGYERELRAKGAGIRTHVLVAIGASLLMLISQYGFPDAVKFDAARIAAGVVGGLGFVCGGIIMKTGNHVSGLTTAVGVWVTGAIGLGMGAGMYELSILASIVLLICLEALNYYTIHLGEKEYSIVVCTGDQKAITKALDGFKGKIKGFSIAKDGDIYKVSATLRFRKSVSLSEILDQISAIPGITLKSLE